MRLLSAEWMKTKRTVVRWIVFFIPLCISACVTVYMTYRSDISFAFIYEGFFTVWSAVLIPMGAGLLTGLLTHQEELAGNFSCFLNTEISRAKLYAGKFFVSALGLTISTFLTTLILCIGIHIVLPYQSNSTVFFCASLLAVIGTLPILAIHLWVSFIWGMGASIGMGICGILMAVLIGTTSLGDTIWMVIPWSYPVKMAMLPLVFSYASSTIIAKAMPQLTLAFAMSIVCFAAFLFGGMLWFSKWEGRK